MSTKCKAGGYSLYEGCNSNGDIALILKLEDDGGNELAGVAMSETEARDLISKLTNGVTTLFAVNKTHTNENTETGSI